MVSSPKDQYYHCVFGLQAASLLWVFTQVSYILLDFKSFFWRSLPPNLLRGEGALKPLFQAHPLLHHCQWHYGKVIETLHNHTCVVVELKNMKALIHACC